jgi:adenylosuccinate lyase
MAGSHERDGRSWKAEWLALPEVCLLTGVALRTALTLATGLVVDADAMRENLTRFGDQSASEQLLAGLAARVGKHRAQETLHALLVAGHAQDLGAALVASGAASAADVREWTGRAAIGTAIELTDELVRSSRAARAAEPEQWCRCPSPTGCRSPSSRRPSCGRPGSSRSSAWARSGSSGTT